MFEAMSGFTTTGLTMTVHEPSLSHALLFYRSFTQWIDGAGIVVLTLAILRQGGAAGDYSLYRSEARQQRVRPSVVTTARSIARVYLAITLLVAAYLASSLFLLEPDYGVANTIFDAVNHAMTGQATGGFSVLDDSIAGYGSYALELVHVPPMILGAIALPLYYRAFSERDLDAFTRDPQVRTLFTLLVFGTPSLVYMLSQGTFPLFSSPGLDLGSWTALLTESAVRDGVFQWVSGLTGTGWQTSGIGAWAAGPVVLLVLFGMNIQGSAGSTTGGVKLIRAYLLAKAFAWEIRRVFLPENAVHTIRVGERTLDARDAAQEFREAALLVVAYLMFLASGTVFYLWLEPGHALSDVFFEVASAQGTVGLSSGLTGPTMNTGAKSSFVFLMWLGRLEIFPVLAFLRALSFGMDFR
jgi:trk system potassium uptake protein TrkH